MNLVHETKLSVFTEVPENKELNVLYSLNQQNTPEVGGLESINDLSKLITIIEQLKCRATYHTDNSKNLVSLINLLLIFF